MELTNFKVDGMQSEACAVKLNDALAGLKGVSKVSVIFASEQVNVNFDGEAVSKDNLKDAIAAAGFRVVPAHGEDGNCCGGCT